MDHRESPGVTVIELGEVDAGAAGESCQGLASAAGEVCVGSWVGSEVCGLSAHVSESPGDELP